MLARPLRFGVAGVRRERPYSLQLDFQRTKGILAGAPYVGALAVSSRREPDLADLYTKQIYVPEPFLSPVQPVDIPGKGLGLQATKDFATGELILLDKPLGVAYGPAGSAPSNEELVEAILKTEITPTAWQWLQLLHSCRGTGSSGSADAVAQAATLLELQQHDDSHEGVTTSSSSTTAEAVADDSSSSSSLPDSMTADGRSSSNDLGEPAITTASSSSSSVPGLTMSGAGSSGTTASTAAVQSDSATCSSTPTLLGTSLKIVSVVPDEAVVAGAVSCNSYGEVSEDVAVGELRDVEALAFTGLWPALALVNHSCAPNTSQLVVGRAMLLRAARPILEGDEITTCYLGQARFTHVVQRRALLASDYGFHCQCNRCLLEHHLFPTRRYPATDAAEQGQARALLSSSSPSSPAAAQPGPLQRVLDTVYGPGRFRVGGTATNTKLLEEVNTQLKDSLEVGVQDSLTALSKAQDKQKAVLTRLNSAIAAVEQEVQQLNLSPRDQMMVTASVGGLYRSRYELLQVSGLAGPEAELDALKDWLDLVEAVARGSDSHLFLAVQYQAKARAVHGHASEVARRAELACAAAHYARYGKVDIGLLRSLMQVRARMATGSAMASRISMMAWESDRSRERGDLDPLAPAIE